ncbi:MAG TPA: hypothetical protein PKE23_05275 [Anaerolineales bacterium]|nr:hypothetical protein [Anaerolineales bacterium]HNE04835.1 hypothetical protein [Anaerolineales bacterium]
MRVLFVSANYHYYFAIDSVVRELSSRGHHVYLSTGMKEKANFPGNIAMEKAQSELPNLEVHQLLRRRFLRSFAQNIRELLNFAHVLKSEDVRKWDVLIWGRFFSSKWVWRLFNTPGGKAKLRNPSFLRMIRALEQHIPVHARIRTEIKNISPDVVLLLPLVTPNALENEYMRAAQSLGIPTIYSMVSWDNLSTKGTFHGYPDYSFVWNKPLADELVDLHGHPRETIFMTGTPRFSHLFDGSNKKEDVFSREELCRQAGMDASKPYVLYVGSTFLVNSKREIERDESLIIREVAEAMLADPRTKDVNILVRPHPQNLAYLSKFLETKPRNVFVYPVNGEIPDTDEKIKRYNSSIHYAAAVLGINTTAYLEVAALNRPCVTLYFNEFAETQRLPHFHHLEEAGFLESARDTSEMIALLERILNGADDLAAQRHEFVKNFLKPLGSEKPSVEYVADLIEEIGSKKQIY